MEPGRGPPEVLPLPETLEKSQLGGPVEQVRALHRVPLEQIQHVCPRFQHMVGPRVGVAAVDQFGDPVQVDPLQRQTGQFPAVGQRHRGAQRRVAREHMHGMHRASQRQIGQVCPDRRPLLDQVENQ